MLKWWDSAVDGIDIKDERAKPRRCCRSFLTLFMPTEFFLAPQDGKTGYGNNTRASSLTLI